MHELPVINRILDICLEHATTAHAKKIITIELKVGELTDLENEWMQRYFGHVSKGTLAEDAKLKITRIPVVLKCMKCQASFSINIRETKDIQCPECGEKKYSFVSGKDYRIENMEVI